MKSRHPPLSINLGFRLLPLAVVKSFSWSGCRVFCSVALLTVLLLTSGSVRAASLDANFTESTFFQNSSPTPNFVSSFQGTSMAWAPDGSNRLFLTRKAGQVRIIENGAMVATPFATETVRTDGECGLLGLAFDPGFATNRFIYLFVTVNATEQQIVRYTASGNLGTNRTVILSGLPTAGQFHNGGGIGFGRDGKIYWAIGDNATNPLTGVDRDTLSLASKVGRANRDGTVPADNPFADGSGPNNDYLWAGGFRNPFTLTFQPGTGDLWVNSVGTGYEQVFVVGRGDNGGWNDFEANQPSAVAANVASSNPAPYARYIKPAIKYRTNGTEYRVIADASTAVATGNGFDSVSVPGAVRSGGIVTITLRSSTFGHNNSSISSNHPFRPGERITITGVADPSFNGVFYIASVLNLPTPTTASTTNLQTNTSFTFVQAGPDAVSGGASTGGISLDSGNSSVVTAVDSGVAYLNTLRIGGSITGGTFLDTTAVPPAYRGNFFFADYNSALVARTTLGTSNMPSSVDLFANGLSSAIDLSIGPDGALYALRFDGSITRWAYNQTAQGLIVTPTQLQTDEGSRIALSVRLAVATTANVSVSVARSSGDADLAVFSGASLTFNSANWSTPQTVVLAAAEDADSINDTADFTISSAGLSSQTATLFALDNDVPELIVTPASLTIQEGRYEELAISLSGPPTSPTTVTTTRTSGDSDLTVTSGASLVFNASNFNTPQFVRLSAAEDADTTADSAVVTVAASGFTSRLVNVSILDDDATPPVITSTPNTQAVVGNPYTTTITASGIPAPVFSITTGPPSMSINPTSGVVTWTPSTPGTFAVTLQASNGSATPASQSFSIIVSPDQPPSASITLPAEGDVIRGSTAEFYGDGIDDVGTVRGEFFIDGVLSYTDTTPGGHYHIGGTHNLFNTTLLSNGPHTLSLRVVDGTGQSAQAQVNVLVANGISNYGAWKLGAFDAGQLADPAIHGNTADYDQDGFNTLLEYFYGGNPLVSDRLGPQLGLSGPQATISFTRRVIASDVTFVVEGTNDLLSGTWSSSGIVLDSTQSLPGGLERLTYLDTTGGSRRFFKIRITDFPSD
jgi:glucose/arabinose dehydrogenase